MSKEPTATDRIFVQEQGRRKRLADTVVGILAWWIITSILVSLTYGLVWQAIGFLLMVLLLLFLAYYFGAGRDKLSSVRLPSPSFAKRIAGLLVGMYVLVAAQILCALLPIVRGWYSYESTSVETISTVASAGFVVLSLILGVTTRAWRHSLLEIGREAG